MKANGNELCNATGKHIFMTKEDAKAALRGKLGAYPGNWKTIWCMFCEHYHNSSTSHGRKGKRDRQRVTRGKR